MSKPWAFFRKNSRGEEVRVSIDEFRCQQLLNIRVWFVADDGMMRPGRQGIAIRLEQVPELLAAIRQVVQEHEGEHLEAPTHAASGRA